MARHPHPVVFVVLEALINYGAAAQVSRIATHGRLDVDLELRSQDGQRIVVNIKEEDR